MEVAIEDELMATVSALDKESALALLAVAQAAPDSSTAADVWAVLGIFKSLGGNANWAHFLYLLRKLEKLGLIKTVKLYRGSKYGTSARTLCLPLSPPMTS